MTQHEEFKALMKELKLTYPKIAEITGLSPDSVKTMLQPNHKFPSWCKLVLWINRKSKE